MPESILTIFKFCFLGLLYLFCARVVRSVYRELSPPAPVTQGDRPGAAAGEARRPGRGRLRGRGRQRAGDAGGPFALRVVEGAPEGTFTLGGEVTIGRAPGCSVPLADDTYVSALHARVYVRDGRPFVEDLGSTNGTFLNTERVSATMPLRHGDRLQVGHTVLEVVR